MKIRIALITAMLFTAALSADKAKEMQPEQPTASLTGPTKTTEEEDNELDVSAERMEILLDGKTIELTDNVRFEDQTMILTASRMKIFLEEEEEKQVSPRQGPPKQDKDLDHENMKLKRIEADGNVVLRKKIDATESVMGDVAVYEVKTDTVTLTGNCVVTQGGHVMKGKLVTFDRLKQKIQVKQAVITIKLPKGKKRGLGNFMSPTEKKD